MDEALCCGAPEHPCGVRGTRLSESHRAEAPVPCDLDPRLFGNDKICPYGNFYFSFYFLIKGGT